MKDKMVTMSQNIVDILVNRGRLVNGSGSVSTLKQYLIERINDITEKDECPPLTMIIMEQMMTEEKGWKPIRKLAWYVSSDVKVIEKMTIPKDPLVLTPFAPSFEEAVQNEKFNLLMPVRNWKVEKDDIDNIYIEPEKVDMLYNNFRYVISFR